MDAGSGTALSKMPNKWSVAQKTEQREAHRTRKRKGELESLRANKYLGGTGSIASIIFRRKKGIDQWGKRTWGGERGAGRGVFKSLTHPESSGKKEGHARPSDLIGKGKFPIGEGDVGKKVGIPIKQTACGLFRKNKEQRRYNL